MKSKESKDIDINNAKHVAESNHIKRVETLAEAWMELEKVHEAKGPV